VAAHDPSDEGGDAKGYALRHGSVILDVAENETGDVNEGCDWAIDRAISAGADWYAWDCDGLGISLKRQTLAAFDGKKIETVMFKGSEAPDDKDAIYEAASGESANTGKTNRQVFRNKRAQYYWRLRDRFYKTFQAVTKGVYIDPDELISLSSDIDCLDQLRAEVCRVPKKPNPNGLIQIMSKADMVKMEIGSPNMADSLMMSMMIPQSNEQFEPINFTSEW
jgi:phage terminase large subunit